MTVFNKRSLLTELEDRTEVIRSNAASFSRLPAELLLQRPAPERWCIAEIFEHLNITHKIYLDAILQKITHSPEVVKETYTSGWLGDWFYEKIIPRPDGSLFKMRAPRFLRPDGKLLNGEQVLEKFNQQLDTLHDILSHVITKDIEKTRVPLSFTKLITIRTGDAIRFIVGHSERHLMQAFRTKDMLIPEAASI